MEKIGPFLLFNFSTWYKVIKLTLGMLMTYEGDHVTLYQNGFWSVHYILDT